MSIVEHTTNGVAQSDPDAETTDSVDSSYTSASDTTLQPAVKVMEPVSADGPAISAVADANVASTEQLSEPAVDEGLLVNAA